MGRLSMVFDVFDGKRCTGDASRRQTALVLAQTLIQVVAKEACHQGSCRRHRAHMKQGRRL